MTILDQVLKEEYDRLSRGIGALREEYEGLPKGYLSEKKIGNNKYYYLQKREGAKIVSKHIKKDDLEAYQTLIERRKRLAKQIKDLEFEQEKLRAALKKAKEND
mgnify:CR=1 FL=1